MTDREHQYSEGQGFDDPYEGFDLEPAEFTIDPNQIDPVDSHALPDQLDEAAIPRDTVDVEALMDVGLSYVQIERYEEATAAFERAAFFADEDSRLQQEAWVNKGVAHAELEEYDDAIGAYQTALDINENNDLASLAEMNLSYALWEFGRDENALVHAERAVERDERNPQAWFNRGFFSIERGLYEDAVNCFENATRLGMRDASVYEEKARALEELGEFDAAEEAAQDAEELREDQERQLLE